MSVERKCKNWLQTFKEWIAPRSEAPESYVFWAGAYTIASALRRRVFLGEKVFGSWVCYPHIYIMFVGPAGMRKTTAMERSVDLMVHNPNIKRPPTLITKESLVDGIMKSPDSSMTLPIGEFSDLIMKGGKEMYDLLTSLYDAKRELSVGTMMRGIEGSSRPCVSMLACTTPDWIAAHVPEASLAGGFASRVLFVYEEELKNRQLYRKKHMNDSTMLHYNQLEQDLIADLIHISSNISGEFDITPEAEEKGEEWYRRIETKNVHRKLQGYTQRKHLQVHKLAMILQVAQSDELIIDWPVLQTAIKIVEATEARLPKVFAGVGKNVYSVTMTDMVDYMRMNSPVSRAAIFTHFQSNAEPDRLQRLIDGLVAMKVVTSTIEGAENDQDFIYTFVKK